MVMQVEYVEVGSHFVRQQNIVRDTVSTANFVTLLIAIYSFSSVLKYIPEIGSFFVYIAILSFFCLIYISIILNSKKPNINLLDLIFLLTSLLFVIFGLYIGNNLLDVIGNFIRFCILFGLLIFWNNKLINENHFFNILFKNIFIISVLTILMKLLGEKFVFNGGISVDLPVLVILYCIALWKKDWLKLFAAIFMIIMTGKESGIIAVIFSTMVYCSIKSVIITFCMVIIFSIVLFNIEIIFLKIIELDINKLNKIGELGLMLIQNKFDENIINVVTSNRWSEYQLLIETWREQGLPVLGYGIGYAAEVYLYHSGEFVERSTFHNSFISIYQNLGLFGLVLIFCYFFSMLIQKNRSGIYNVIASGCIIYCFFNYSLLQAPSIIMIFAMFHRAKLVDRIY